MQLDETRSRIRVLKNRLAAKKSRDTAKLYAEEMEARVRELTEENCKLMERVQSLEQQLGQTKSTFPGSVSRSGSLMAPAVPNHSATGVQRQVTNPSRKRERGPPAPVMLTYAPSYNVGFELLLFRSTLVPRR